MMRSTLSTFTKHTNRSGSPSHFHEATLDHVGGAQFAPQVPALQSHVLLQHEKDQFGFRFEFLANYLAARALMTHLEKDPANPRVVQLLERECRGGPVVLERAV